MRERGSTFFEITTAMGLLHFARKNVGAVVLEVGMGGRLDSTNVVHPALSIITSISFDHTRQLGNTLAAIATEKAGICKRGRPVVSGVRDGEPRDAIRRVALEAPVPAPRAGGRFLRTKSIAPEPPLVRPTTCLVEARTWRTEWGRLSLPLLGRHQAHNAAVALAGLDVLAEVEPSLTVQPRRRRPRVRRAALAGSGRGGRRKALARDRRCAQRRLGRRSGRYALRLASRRRGERSSSARLETKTWRRSSGRCSLCST